MKIGFNFLHSGLANNGGTRTLLKSAQVIEKLGHEVELIATIDKFTWFKHKNIVSNISEDLDVIIATACTTVASTIETNISKKAWYIRGHEIWSKSELELKKLYQSDLIKFVNSNWLKEKSAFYDTDTIVIYQGLDFDCWQDLKLREENKKIRIGCLYSRKKTKGWRKFICLANALDSRAYEFVAFGAERIEAEFLSEYLYNPSTEALNKLYSSCHIWFAPTELEGLHNVPMEAALCGCLVVCNSVPSNGMVMDYAFKNKTAMVYDDLNEAIDIINNPDWSLVQAMQEYLRQSIGTREYNMNKLINHLAVNEK